MVVVMARCLIPRVVAYATTVDPTCAQLDQCKGGPGYVAVRIVGDPAPTGNRTRRLIASDRDLAQLSRSLTIAELAILLAHVVVPLLGMFGAHAADVAG